MIGALCFAAMGIGITGFVRSAEGSSAVINAVYLPMAIISGTFFTPKDYPEFLRVIAEILPLTHFTELTRDVMVRDQHIWSDSGALARRRRLGRGRARRRRPRLPLAAARRLSRPALSPRPLGLSRLRGVDRLDPLRVAPRRPVLAHPAARDPVQRVPRPRQITASQRWPRKRISETYISQSWTSSAFGEPEARVALAVPEEEAADREQDREGGGDDRVQLLAGVQPALRRVAAEEPAAVVGVEVLDLVHGARAGTRRSPTTSDEHERDRPGDRRVDVDRLQERPPADEPRRGSAGRGRARSRAGRRRRPRAPSAPRARCGSSGGGARGPRRSRSHSSGRPRRPGRSRGLPSSRSAGRRRARSCVSHLTPL